MINTKRKKSYSLPAISLLIVVLLLLIILSQLRATNQSLRGDIERKEQYIKYLLIENTRLGYEVEELQKQLEEQRNKSIDLEAFMVATWKIETGGTSYLWTVQNNPGGIKNNQGEYIAYESKQAGSKALEQLMIRYLNKYGTMRTRDLRDEYCGNCGDDDYNLFMELLNKEYERLGR